MCLASIGGAFILAVFLGASQSSQAETCTGPGPLEARLRAHPSSGAHFALGDWFADNRKPGCAVQAFQSALKLETDPARRAYLQGLSLYTAGHAQEALAPLQQSIRLHPADAQARMALGADLATLGHNKEALAEWEAALKIDPASKKALHGLAKALLAIGDDATVISRLGSAPRDENLTLDLGAALKNAGQTDDAIHLYIEALKAYPNSDVLTSALVSLYDYVSQFEQGSQLAEKLAHEKPGDLEAQRIYLRTLTATGNIDVATALARKLLALAPHDAEFLQKNGFLERKAGDFTAARKHLEEAIALDPNDYAPRMNLALTLVELKDAAGARGQLEKAIALGDTDPQVRFELAKVLRALGKTEEAQQQLKLYQQQLQEESDRYAAGLKAADAARAAKAGDNRKAADLYREACALQPGDAGLAYRLALVLAGLGDSQGEKAALEQAVKADPNFIHAQYLLGFLAFQAGDNPTAERQFRLTAEALPSNVQAWLSLASTLAKESRFPEAQDAVGNALKLEPDNATALRLKRMLAAAQSQH